MTNPLTYAGEYYLRAHEYRTRVDYQTKPTSALFSRKNVYANNNWRRSQKLIRVKEGRLGCLVVAFGLDATEMRFHRSGSFIRRSFYPSPLESCWSIALADSRLIPFVICLQQSKATRKRGNNVLRNKAKKYLVFNEGY